MTIAQLYALYRRAYLEFDLVHGSAIHADGRSPIVQAVVEFAETEVLNGRPLRTCAEFERCLAHGADALRTLGLRAA